MIPITLFIYLAQKILNLELPQAVWLMLLCLLMSGLKHAFYEIKNYHSNLHHKENVRANTLSCEKLLLELKKSRNFQNVHNITETKSPVITRKIKKQPVVPESAQNTFISTPIKQNTPYSQIINSHGKFTFFKLHKADFPSEECFKKFQPMITEDPKIVPHRNTQGLVYSKKFGGTLKAKALGKFGDVRVYATKKEIAETGETLYIFDRLVLKAH
jgi:hypothetical protein